MLGINVEGHSNVTQCWVKEIHWSIVKLPQNCENGDSTFSSKWMETAEVS